MEEKERVAVEVAVEVVAVEVKARAAAEVVAGGARARAAVREVAREEAAAVDPKALREVDHLEVSITMTMTTTLALPLVGVRVAVRGRKAAPQDLAAGMTTTPAEAVGMITTPAEATAVAREVAREVAVPLVAMIITHRAAREVAREVVVAFLAAMIITRLAAREAAKEVAVPLAAMIITHQEAARAVAREVAHLTITMPQIVAGARDLITERVTAKEVKATARVVKAVKATARVAKEERATGRGIQVPLAKEASPATITPLVTTTILTLAAAQRDPRVLKGAPVPPVMIITHRQEMITIPADHLDLQRVPREAVEADDLPLEMTTTRVPLPLEAEERGKAAEHTQVMFLSMNA